MKREYTVTKGILVRKNGTDSNNKFSRSSPPIFRRGGGNVFIGDGRLMQAFLKVNVAGAVRPRKDRMKRMTAE